MRQLSARPFTIAVFLVSAFCQHADAQEKWLSPESPFRLGEAYPDVAATCETADDWIGEAPAIEDRISFAITGKLTAVEWDGTLAYLIMCDEKDVQVMCVTYSADGRTVGDLVTFGGGFSRAGGRQILLDPCLASEESG